MTADLSDFDTIILDLLPDEAAVGKLNEQSDAEHLALKDFKSLFHFEVKPELRVHGLGVFEEGGPARPATLFVLSIQAIPARQARPIKWASVKITFEKEENPLASAKKKAPRVRHVAPGLTPLQIECTVERQTTSDTNEYSAGAQGGGSLASANLAATSGHEKGTEKEQKFYTSLSAVKRPSPGHRFSNEVEWFFEGNASQSSGIAPELAVALLLERPAESGEFVCAVEINVEVDWLATVQEWFTYFPIWKRKTGWYTVDPAKPKTGGGTFNSDHMESYMKEDEIRPLWYINMPKIYKHFKMEEKEPSD